MLICTKNGIEKSRWTRLENLKLKIYKEIYKFQETMKSKRLTRECCDALLDNFPSSGYLIQKPLDCRLGI